MQKDNEPTKGKKYKIYLVENRDSSSSSIIVTPDSGEKKIDPVKDLLRTQNYKELSITEMQLLFTKQSTDEDRADDPIIILIENLLDVHQKNSSQLISEIAERLNISRSTLYRKLTKRYKLSGTELVNRIKLEKARRLLADPNLSIAEVAYASGYSSASYFIKRFKREFQTTPTIFRKNNE